jgi:hypothetical protein
MRGQLAIQPSSQGEQTKTNGRRIGKPFHAHHDHEQRGTAPRAPKSTGLTILHTF